MQTTLERINEQVEAKIAAVESGTERPVGPRMEPESIAGFPIPEEITRPRHEEACTALALRQISEYRKTASELRVKLMEAGITPLAILPAKAWYRLCDRSKLYLLFPNKSGGVQFDAAQNLVHSLRVDHPTLVDVVIGVASGLIAACITYWVLSLLSVSDGLYVGTVAAGGAWGWMAGAISYHNLNAGRFARNVREYLKDKTWAEVLADLAPNRRIYGGNDWDHTKLELPAPPASVAEILMRARRARLDLRVAAEADAVQFSGGVEKLLGEQYRQMLIAEENARRDPIVFVDYGGKNSTYVDDTAVVAVVAQFGDFPIEQAALDEVVGRGVL